MTHRAVIVNPFSVIAASGAIIQLIVGIMIAVLGGFCIRAWALAPDSEERQRVENAVYLVLMLAGFLAGLIVLSWPLLYLVLQSYVPEWPGVMCIYGVTRIGLGSYGAPGYLPKLLSALLILKPILVLLTGAWSVLNTVHRKSSTRWLLRPILIVLMIVGLMGSLDASFELTYLAIPKKNNVRSMGCCPAPNSFVADVSAHQAVEAVGTGRWLGTAYPLTNGVLVFGLILYRKNRKYQARLIPILALLALAVTNFAVSVAYVATSLTPVLLRQPGHHCLYDLLQGAPQVALALALLAWGSLSVSWTVLAGLMSRFRETSSFIGDLVNRIARWGEFSMIASLLLIAGSLLASRP